MPSRLIEEEKAAVPDGIYKLSRRIYDANSVTQMAQRRQLANKTNMLVDLFQHVHA